MIWKLLPFFWISVIVLAIVIVYVPFDDAKPLTIYMVSSTRQAVSQNLLDCGNVGIESKREADAYAKARPGTHVFEIQIREVH